jgi:hypothetical protein
MKFFFPGVDDPDQAERAYAILRALAAARHGALSPRRIFSIAFNRGRHAHAATVGAEDTASGRPCVAIFEAARGAIYTVYPEGRLSNGHLVSAPYLVEPFD